MRGGKSSELHIASQLIRAGLDIYQPFVDDLAIDLIVRVQRRNEPEFYEIQVKSVKGYNSILGVKDTKSFSDNYLIVIHYRHNTKDDEIIYLTKYQIQLHHKPESSWGDLVINKPERKKYKNQTIEALARAILEKNI
jgi:hypothetical protein